MKNSIIAYSLSGMGCSGALLSLDLVRDLFQIHRNAHAVVVSTETINATWYRGNNRVCSHIHRCSPFIANMTGYACCQHDFPCWMRRYVADQPLV